MMPVPLDANGQPFMPLGHPIYMPPHMPLYTMYGEPYRFAPVLRAQTPSVGPSTVTRNPSSSQHLAVPAVPRPAFATANAPSQALPRTRSSRQDSEAELTPTTKVEVGKKKVTSVGLPTSQWPKPSEAAAQQSRKVPTSADPAATSKTAGNSEASQPKQPQSRMLGNEDNKPPPNAPTGPRALRQSQARKAKSQAVILKSTPESGSWSQSKRWVSQETKERKAFHKMKLNLHHIRADDSPFVPQTPAALTAMKLEGDRRRLSREVDRRVAEKEKEGTLRLFGGKRLGDMLSPVLGWNHCFTEG